MDLCMHARQNDRDVIFLGNLYPCQDSGNNARNQIHHNHQHNRVIIFNNDSNKFPA